MEGIELEHVHVDAEKDLEMGKAARAGELFDERMLEEMNLGEDASPASQPKALGTLAGVYLPCLQNILGVILFLRLPWITAQAGVWLTSAIVVICVTITTLTSLSLSAMATNGKIAAGGPYYIVSRNLGQELGFAIGLLFYLGTTIAGCMYVLGAVEAFQTAFSMKDQFAFDTQVEALALMLVLTCVVIIGVKYVNMAASVFLATVLLSFLSYTVGISLFAAGVVFGDSNSLQPADRVAGDNMGPAIERDPATGLTPSFVSLLALFFPSVTGIMAGTNRSALLRDPARSIPRGTLSAVLTTTLMYFATIFLFGFSVSNDTLKGNKLVVAAAAWPHSMIVNVGVILSCVGAALQCLVGAPQLLNAIAMDQVIRPLRFFAAGFTRPPRRAIWLTWLIASLPCLAGNLDFVSPVITMFFLMMYGTMNLACFTLAILRQPSFRPRWRYFHSTTALVGVLLCLVMMLLIGWYYALAAISLGVVLYIYAAASGAQKNWGDARNGIKYELARSALLSMADDEEHTKTWRPQLLVLCEVGPDGSPLNPQLVEFAGQLKKGRGLALVHGILVGQLPRMHEQVEPVIQALQALILRAKMYAFASASVHPSMREGMWAAAQTIGISQLRPNTALLAWPDWASGDWAMDRAPAFVKALHGVRATGKSLLVLKGEAFPTRSDRLQGTIDIWWVVHDGGLLTLIPYLLRLHKVWRHCRLRLFSVASASNVSVTMNRQLRHHVRALRIDAEVTVVELAESDISRAAADRTMNLQARREMLRQLRLSTLTMPPDQRAAPARPALASLFAPLAAVSEASSSDARSEPDIHSATEAASPHTEHEAELPTSGTDGETADAQTEGDTDGDGNDPQKDGAVRFAQRSRAASEMTDDATAADDEADSEDGGGPRPTRSALAARLSTAMRLNRLILDRSSEAQLVVLNFPISSRTPPEELVEYVNVLTSGLRRALLVRGSGKEFVTEYA